MPVRTYTFFPLEEDADLFQSLALRWAERHFKTAAFLNSNAYKGDRFGSLPWAYALGSHEEPELNNRDAIAALKEFADASNDWLFGFFSYELKNQLEPLQSKNPDGIGMPLCHFFRPVVLILPAPGGMRIGTLPGYGVFSDPQAVYDMIMETEVPDTNHSAIADIKARVGKERYLRQLQAIKKHIQQGDVYEMNYCIEFFAEEAEIDPVTVYHRLNGISQAPFSCFYATEGKYLMCASPERFMRKDGVQLISQPIKGTSPRGKSAEEDELFRKRLYEDPKERSENVMIVDLVRNDLSRTAQKGSVKVEELYGIYPFRQVNQMISTVTSSLHPDAHYLDAIRYAFPMGSMTGAPKYRAMELIDIYEDTCRGLYSGAAGYISPEKNFDFNVVIRSILYNAPSKYLSYMAGSAITIGSDPEREYEECLLKARAMGRAIMDVADEASGGIGH